jgi:hypothetical protein
MVLLDWRQLRSTAEYPWDRLCDALNGEGVQSVDEALSKLRLRPLHEALRHAVSANTIGTFVAVSRELAKGHAVAPKVVAAADKAAVRSEIALPVAGSPVGGASPETARAALDSRLGGFVERSQYFFDRAVEMLPSEDMAFSASSTIKAKASVGAVVSAAAKPLEVPKDPRQLYKERVEEMATAAAHVFSLDKDFSTSWPKAGRSLLPQDGAGMHSERAWAGVLAWIVVSSMPWKHEGAVFDKLQLRSAIAEIFSSMGLEGEQMWRAAARVRVLLSLSGGALAKPDANVADRMHTEAFWADPDVQWLAGVNKAGGATYFNKEGFEEMVCWLQLPGLIEIARFGSGVIGKIEAGVTDDCRVALASGYKLDTYLSAWRPKVAEKARASVDVSVIDASVADATELSKAEVEVEAAEVDAGQKGAPVKSFTPR